MTYLQVVLNDLELMYDRGRNHTVYFSNDPTTGMRLSQNKKNIENVLYTRHRTNAEETSRSITIFEFLHDVERELLYGDLEENLSEEIRRETVHLVEFLRAFLTIQNE